MQIDTLKNQSSIKNIFITIVLILLEFVSIVLKIVFNPPKL